MKGKLVVPGSRDEKVAPVELSDTDLASEIENFERRFADTGIVARLNGGVATDEEREGFGLAMARLTTLRREVAERQLRAFEVAVDSYERTHAERVERYIPAEN